MQTTIAFLINNKFDINIPQEVTHLFLDDSYTILDSFSAKSSQEILYFDYLVFDNFDKLDRFIIEKEHKRAITNYYMQTNIENFFAIGEASNCLLPLDEQLERIIESIISE